MAFANLAGAVVSFEPPLIPSADEARQLLENELSNPIYQPPSTPWYERILERIMDFLSSLSGTGFSSVSLLWVLLAVFIFFVVVFVLAGPVRRARKAKTRSTVFESTAIKSSQYEDRAKRAAAQGDFSQAAVEMYRAIVRRAEEDVLISAAPGRTAHEAADAMSASVPSLREQYSWASIVFDSVEYGSSNATSHDVATLDDLLEQTKSAVLVERDTSDTPTLVSSQTGAAQ